MSSNLPQGRRQSLEWLEGIITQWNANAAGIGLTSAQTLDLAQDIVNARADFTDTDTARNASKIATQDWYTGADELHLKASAFITTIKGFAKTSNNANAIYTLAGLTAKAPPTPAAPPQTPTINNAVLVGDGAVTINFTGTGALGTVWQVSRKLAGETAFTIIGTADAATKSYTDTTLPAGSDSATYIVKGVRGSVSGQPSFPLTAQFGGADAAAAAAA